MSTAEIPPARRELPTLVDLCADCPEAFSALLVWMREGSGLTYGQLAIKSKMARSQVYNLTGPGKPVFPTIEAQVEGLGHGCGLGDPEVARLLQVWQSLRDQNPPAARAGWW